MALVLKINVLKSDILTFQKIVKNQSLNLHPLKLYLWKAMNITFLLVLCHENPFRNAKVI